MFVEESKPVMSSPSLIPTTNGILMENSNNNNINNNSNNNNNNNNNNKKISFDLTLINPLSTITSMTMTSNVQTKWDMDFRDRIWGGKVAVLFSLVEHEVISKKPPAAVLSLLPRMSYFPLVTDHVRTHFIPHAPALQDGMWFECGITHNVLKWHTPIGVLYDAYVPLNYSLPWNIIVHFQSYPTRPDIGRCDHIDVVKRSYFNALKQALFLGYNNIHMLVNLKKEDQDQLWTSVIQAKHESYFSIQNVMFDPTKEDHSLTKKLLRYPFRIILQGFSTEFDSIPIQRVVEVPDKDDKTLEQVLRPIIPGIMKIIDSEKEKKKDKEKSVHVKIQGLNVPLDASMNWLVKHMSHADYFLYVIIVKNSITKM